MTRFCAKSVFYCYKKFIFYLFILKVRKKYNGAYGEKIENYLNCHNFGCVQDRVVIFGFRIWFSGTA